MFRNVMEALENNTREDVLKIDFKSIRVSVFKEALEFARAVDLNQIEIESINQYIQSKELNADIKRAINETKKSYRKYFGGNRAGRIEKAIFDYYSN